jgi:hypothetical protein
MTQTIIHTEAINGWNAFAGFIPAKQIGVVASCSCDSIDADMGSLGFVLVHLTGIENINARVSREHIAFPVRLKTIVNTKIDV